MNQDGKPIGVIHQMQEEGKTIPEAKKGEQVAVSIMGPTIGRQVNEGDILYTLPSEVEVRTLNQKYLSMLSDDAKQLLQEIIQVRRKTSSLYGY